MTQREEKAVCPTCRAAAPAPAENDAFPFCSRRCQLVDLGGWLDERYRIPVEDSESPGDPERREQ